LENREKPETSFKICGKKERENTLNVILLLWINQKTHKLYAHGKEIRKGREKITRKKDAR
jgi:hypothetical protein